MKAPTKSRYNTSAGLQFLQQVRNLAQVKSSDVELFIVKSRGRSPVELAQRGQRDIWVAHYQVRARLWVDSSLLTTPPRRGSELPIDVVT